MNNNAAPIELFQILPPNFGDGWMSRNAADLCRIAVSIAGFDPAELVRTINVIHKSTSRSVNCATVENAMQVISVRHDNEKGTYRDV